MILPVKGAQDVSFASLTSFVFAKTPILKNLFCAGEAVGSLDCGSSVKRASLRDLTPCPSRVLYKEVIGALARPKSRATNPRTGAATSDVPINGFGGAPRDDGVGDGLRLIGYREDSDGNPPYLQPIGNVPGR